MGLFDFLSSANGRAQRRMMGAQERLTNAYGQHLPWAMDQWRQQAVNGSTPDQVADENRATGDFQAMQRQNSGNLLAMLAKLGMTSGAGLSSALMANQQQQGTQAAQWRSGLLHQRQARKQGALGQLTNAGGQAMQGYQGLGDQYGQMAQGDAQAMADLMKAIGMIYGMKTGAKVG
jgi:hypothetical protein